MSWHDGETYVDEVAGGVYAFVQPDGGWMVNNTGFVVGPSGRSVLVDSSSTERRTRAFLAEVNARASAAPMAMVNTHHHPDHTYGNYLVPAATPVVAHDLCRAEALAAGLEAIRVITAPDYGNLVLRPPDITFTTSLTLHLDDVPMELHHVGPAHTNNDVIAWLPEQRVLFAGDVAFAGGQPFLLDGSVAGFPKALAAIRGLQPEVLVPGHGPVCRGGEVARLLDDLDAYIAFVAETARTGHEAGLTPLEAAQKHRDNPFSHWRETERLVGNLHRAYAELDGLPDDTRLSVPEVWPDMVTFHGGPIECHA
jgi:cyclase